MKDFLAGWNGIINQESDLNKMFEPKDEHKDNEGGLSMERCPNCKSSNMVKGEILVYNLTPIYFSVKGERKQIHAYNCLDCGGIVIITDNK